MDIWIYVFHKISHLLVTCSSSLAMVDPHLVAVSGTGRASCTKQKNSGLLRYSYLSFCVDRLYFTTQITEEYSSAMCYTKKCTSVHLFDAAGDSDSAVFN